MKLCHEGKILLNTKNSSIKLKVVLSCKIVYCIIQDNNNYYYYYYYRTQFMWNYEQVPRTISDILHAIIVGLLAVKIYFNVR